MPYIALQLVGIQAVLTVMGVGATSNNTFVKDLPLFVAFVVLAIFTYVSGLRAPALIAFIKDTLIYLFVIVAVFYIPTRSAAGAALRRGPDALRGNQPGHQEAPNGTFIPTTKSIGSTQFDFMSLALGWRSRCSCTARDHRDPRGQHRSVVKRNMSYLPMYSVLLELIALIGYMALADKTTVKNVAKTGNAQLSLPFLFQHVPELVHRGRLRRHHHRRAGPGRDHVDRAPPTCSPGTSSPSSSSRTPRPRCRRGCPSWVSLVVKLGALLFAVELPHTFSINLQLLGGVWILQLAPMLIGGLFTRWFHRWALLTGWLAGMVFGTLAAYNVSSATASHWAASSDIEFGHTIYIGLSAVVLNLVIAVVLTLILRAARVPEGTDETLPGQYTADPEQAQEPAPAEVAAAP